MTCCQLRSLGFEVSSGATAEQACECAVRGEAAAGGEAGVHEGEGLRAREGGGEELERGEAPVDAGEAEVGGEMVFERGGGGEGVDIRDMLGGVECGVVVVRGGVGGGGHVCAGKGWEGGRCDVGGRRMGL